MEDWEIGLGYDDEDIDEPKEEINWDAFVTELLIRAADGIVSDDDVAFVLGVLPKGDPKLWLQSLVDKIGKENFQLLMALYLLYKTRS